MLRDGAGGAAPLIADLAPFAGSAPLRYALKASLPIGKLPQTGHKSTLA